MALIYILCVFISPTGMTWGRCISCMNTGEQNKNHFYSLQCKKRPDGSTEINKKDGKREKQVCIYKERGTY